MNEKPPPPESRIVWRLPRAEKSRYVRAAQIDGLPLIGWLKQAADKAADKAEKSRPRKQG